MKKTTPQTSHSSIKARKLTPCGRVWHTKDISDAQMIRYRLDLYEKFIRAGDSLSLAKNKAGLTNTNAAYRINRLAVKTKRFAEIKNLFFEMRKT